MQIGYKSSSVLLFSQQTYEKWGHLGFLERGGGGGILAMGEGMAPLTNYGTINSNDMYVF